MQGLIHLPCTSSEDPVAPGHKSMFKFANTKPRLRYLVCDGYVVHRNLHADEGLDELRQLEATRLTCPAGGTNRGGGIGEDLRLPSVRASGGSRASHPTPEGAVGGFGKASTVYGSGKEKL